MTELEKSVERLQKLTQESTECGERILAILKKQDEKAKELSDYLTGFEAFLREPNVKNRLHETVLTIKQ